MKDALITALTILRPLLEVLITTVGPIFVTWLAYRMTTMLNLKNEAQKAAVEEQTREALHRAAENALLYAMTKFGLKGADGTNLSENLLDVVRKAGRNDQVASAKLESVIDSAVNEYLIPKMPDAIRKLKASETDLADIVLSKVAKV